MPPLNILRLPSTLRRRARRSRIMTLLILLSLFVLVILLPAYWIYKPPGFLIAAFSRHWPDVLFSVPASSLPPGSKTVALTIDDAPSGYTPQILQILRDNDVQATFFVIGGQVAPMAEQRIRLTDIVRRGHELGNHAMHDEASRSLSDDELSSEMVEVEDMLARAYEEVLDEKIWTASRAEKRPDKEAREINARTLDRIVKSTGEGGQAARAVSYDSWQFERRQDAAALGIEARRPPGYFRPGSGFFSTRMRALVSRLGYKMILGSVYPHDAQIGSWEVNARHILSMVRPGAVIICHDRRSWTVPMLEHVLPELRRRGYHLTTVSGLLEEAGRIPKKGATVESNSQERIDTDEMLRAPQ